MLSADRIAWLVEMLCAAGAGVRGAVASAHEVHEATLTTAEARMVDPRWHAIRRHEFAMGRLAAHRALRRLGGGGRLDILKDGKGAPVWPPRTRGSITHTRGHAVAIVAPRCRVALGVDLVETAEAFPALLPLVLAKAESRPASPSGLACLIASKEAAIKAYWDGRRSLLSFADLVVSGDGRSVVAADGTGAAVEARSDGRFTVALCLVAVDD